MAESSEFQPKIYYSPDGTPGGPPESDLISKSPEEQEWGERLGREEGFKAGYALTEVYRTLPNPEAIRSVTRELMAHSEDISLTLENLSSKYDLAHILSPLRDRRFALGYTNEQLRRLGIVVEREGKIETTTSGFALRVDTREVEKESKKTIISQQLDEKGNPKKDREGKALPPKIERRKERITVNEEVPYLGSDQERKEVADALKEAEAEIVVRQLEFEHFKVYVNNTDNLEGLVQFYLYFQPTPEAFRIFFNLKDVAGAKTETRGGGEVKTFGDKVDMAMRLYFIVALSEKPEELEKLRRSPGWKVVFPNSTPEQPSVEELQWLGKASVWAKGRRQKIEGVLIDLKKEVEEGTRRGVVARGNIFAHYGFKHDDESGPVQEEMIRKTIRDFLGGDASAQAAEELGFRLFKLWAIAAEMGFEVYQNEEGKAELEYEMGPATDDFAKLTRPWMYQWKQISKPGGRRRDAGPLATWGRYDRLFVSFIRRTGYKIRVSGYPEELGGEVQTRSILEQWWGYSPEENLPGEPAKRLGEIDWTKLSPGALNLFYLGAYMAGRKEIGIYQLTRKTDWNPTSLLELTNPDWWGNFHKYIQVAINDTLAADGIWRGKKEEDVKTKQQEIWDNIVRGLWDGIRSLPQYIFWEKEGISVSLSGTAERRVQKIVPIIINVVKEVTNGRVVLETQPLRHERKEFWHERVKNNTGLLR